MHGQAGESIRFSTFPQTAPPPDFVEPVISAFEEHSSEISTDKREKGLKSNEVLTILRPDLQALGFDVETGKRKTEKIQRPVFFGENGVPTLRYEIDAYHQGWRCGMEVEAGRGWKGNAIYRDLVQAAVMVNVHYLILAVSNSYKYRTRDAGVVVSRDYENTLGVAQALYGHTRLTMPYGLVLIGY